MSPGLLSISKRKYSEQRSPTLNTVLMVEEALKKADLMTVAELKRRLPKQVMHQTLMAVIDYLDYSGKIVLRDGKVLWVFKGRSKLRKAEGMRVR